MLKLKLKFFSLLILLSLITFTGKLYSQEVDIVPYLKAIENGNIGQAKEALVDLKEKNAADPSVMFLDAVLKENGQEAVVIYQDIVDNHPKSKYADAALYRIFSYYYALGLYETAQEKLKQLKTSYPASPYINVADQNLSALEKSDVKETETVVEEIKPKVEENYKFTIQAGAFTNLDNANKLIGEFEAAGIFSRLGEKIVGGTTFHVVYAGKFEKYEDAEDFLQVVNSRYKVNGSIVSIPPQ
ncbi:MAG: SPOR domain-containing protein [Ignavibacteriaceae bacterium]|nr:SPOR domain-containing protein [Ignavibacteriaceae bacterium]